MVEFPVPVKVNQQYPMSMDEPVENVQLPLTSHRAPRNAESDAVEFQTTFVATIFPVFATPPPIDNAPLKVAVPATVSWALAKLVPLMVSVAPELTVRLLHTGDAVPLIYG